MRKYMNKIVESLKMKTLQRWFLCGQNDHLYKNLHTISKGQTHTHTHTFGKTNTHVYKNLHVHLKVKWVMKSRLQMHNALTVS